MSIHSTTTHAQFKTEPPLERLSREDVLSRYHCTRDHFLMKLGFNVEARDALRPIIAKMGFEQGLYAIALADLIGISAERTVEYFFRHVGNKYLTTKKCILDLNDATRWWSKELDAQHSTFTLSSGERVKVFPATFRMFDADYGRECLGAVPGARVFAMFLPEAERRVIRQVLNDTESDHIFDSFAYIRYYQQGANFEIVEIQSDLYGRIEQRSLREKYKHWSKLLLIAFESFAKEESDSEDITLHFPSADTMRKRWPDYRVREPVENGYTIETQDEELHYGRGLADELAKRLYWDLPLSCGYTTEYVDELFIERSSLGFNAVSVDYRWVKKIDENVSNDPRLQLKETERDPDFWLLKSEDLIPHHLLAASISLPRAVHYPSKRALSISTTKKIQGIEIVPVNRIEFATLPGVREHSLDYTRSRKTLRDSARAVIPSGLACMSKAVIEDIADACDFDSRSAEDPAHSYYPYGELRGPTIQIHTNSLSESELFIETLGGGLALSSNTRNAGRKGQSSWHYPLYINNEKDKECAPTKSGWLAKTDAETIAASYLALSHLFELSELEGQPLVPTPVEVGVFSTLPVFHDNGSVKWLDPVQYCLEAADCYELDVASWPSYVLLATEDSVNHLDLISLYRTKMKSDIQSKLLKRIVDNFETQMERSITFLGVIHGAGAALYDFNVDYSGILRMNDGNVILPHIRPYQGSTLVQVAGSRLVQQFQETDLFSWALNVQLLRSILDALLHSDSKTKEVLLSNEWYQRVLKSENVNALVDDPSIRCRYEAGLEIGLNCKERWESYL